MNTLKNKILQSPIMVFFLLFFFGVAIRNLYLEANLLFGFEQGRDFFVARDIASLKKLTLIGPKTDIEGIFHGAYYYYILALFFKASGGNPFFIAYIFTFISALTSFIVYKICGLFFSEKKWTIWGAILSTFSFNLIIYSRWISNVTLAIPVFALFLYFLVLKKKGKSSLAFPLAMFFGFLILHLELLGIFQVLTILIFSSFYFRFKLKIMEIVLSFMAVFVNLLPFIYFDLKHQFLLISNIYRYVFQSQENTPFNLFKNISNYLIGLDREISSTLFPVVGNYSLIIYFIFFIVLIFIFKKMLKSDFKLFKFFAFLIFASFPLIFFLKFSSLEQFYVGTSISVILAFVFMMRQTTIHFPMFSHIVFIPVTFIVLLGNLFHTITSLKTRNNIFYYTSQKEVAIGRKMKVIKHLISQNENYNFDAFTSPLYRPDGWNFLNEWQKTKNLRADLIRSEPKILFLAIEPFTDKHWLSIWLNKYDRTSKLINSETIEGIILQRRIII